MMNSTLLARLCSPEDLTPAQKDAFDARWGRRGSHYRVDLRTFCAVVQEVAASAAKAEDFAAPLRLVESEVEDLNMFACLVKSEAFSVSQIERILFLGDSGYYALDQIRARLSRR